MPFSASWALISAISRSMSARLLGAPTLRRGASPRRLACGWSNLALLSRAVSWAFSASTVACALTLSISPMVNLPDSALRFQARDLGKRERDSAVSTRKRSGTPILLRPGLAAKTGPCPDRPAQARRGCAATSRAGVPRWRAALAWRDGVPRCRAALACRLAAEADVSLIVVDLMQIWRTI